MPDTTCDACRQTTGGCWRHTMIVEWVTIDANPTPEYIDVTLPFGQTIRYRREV